MKKFWFLKFRNELEAALNCEDRGELPSAVEDGKVYSWVCGHCRTRTHLVIDENGKRVTACPMCLKFTNHPPHNPDPEEEWLKRRLENQ